MLLRNGLVENPELHPGDWFGRRLLSVPCQSTPAAGGVLAHFARLMPIPTSSSASGTQIAAQSISVGVLTRSGPEARPEFGREVRQARVSDRDGYVCDPRSTFE